MPFRTDIPDITTALLAQLVLKSVAPESALLPVATDDYDSVPHLVGEMDVLLAFQEERQSNADSAGRHATIATAGLHVVVRSRLYLDAINTNRQALLDATRGHYRLRSSVRDALHCFLPVASSNNALLVEPLKWLGTSRPRNERVVRGWVQSVLMFSLKYFVDLDQSMQ